MNNYNKNKDTCEEYRGYVIRKMKDNTLLIHNSKNPYDYERVNILDIGLAKNKIDRKLLNKRHIF